MKKFKQISILSALLLSSMIQAKDEQKMSWKSTQVAEGLYMLSGEGGFTGGNIGLSVGEDGVILIDNGMPTSLGILNDAIKGITENSIDFLINTHVHGDHAGNNATMGEQGVHIVAHENLRTHLMTKGVPAPDGSMQPAAKSALPVITFSHSMDFHLNGMQAHVFHLPSAHTDGDSAIHFTDVNVIHMGDTFFHKLFPYIDYSSGASLEGYIAAQKTVLARADDETKIIPGHGPLASKKDLEESIAMLEDAKMMVSNLVKEGKSEEEILNINPLEEKYGSLSWGFITTEIMTKQLINGVSQSAEEHSHEGSEPHSH